MSETIDKKALKKLSILYVEDDESTREEASFFLKKIAGELHIASNGQEGLELFNKHDIDMVITDIQMPVMNGLDMVKNIKTISPDIPIAVTTAFSDSEYLIKAIELGVDKYILKPIDVMEMMAVIYKSTKNKFLEQKIEAQDAFSKFIIDQTPTFMLILKGKEIEHVNQQLMNIFGFHSANDFYANPLYFLEDQQISKIDNWIDYVMSNNRRLYTIVINKKDSNIPTGKTKKFHLAYHCFKDLDKSIFVFYDDEQYSSVCKVSYQSSNAKTNTLELMEQ